jgi:hypothetical protein
VEIDGVNERLWQEAKRIEALLFQHDGGRSGLSWLSRHPFLICPEK